MGSFKLAAHDGCFVVLSLDSVDNTKAMVDCKMAKRFDEFFVAKAALLLAGDYRLRYVALVAIFNAVSASYYLENGH